MRPQGLTPEHQALLDRFWRPTLELSKEQRYQDILCSYHDEGLSLRAVGQVFNLHNSTIHHIMKHYCCVCRKKLHGARQVNDGFCPECVLVQP